MATTNQNLGNLSKRDQSSINEGASESDSYRGGRDDAISDDEQTYSDKNAH